MSSQQAHAQVPPPEFLQLAGHPLRWRLLGELARSDRMVHELTGLVGEPQNLVSYHLGKLRDGRPGLGAAQLGRSPRRLLHGRSRPASATCCRPPAGRSTPAFVSPRRRASAAGAGAVRVLFLCTGNSARSQMAEALARARSGGVVEAYSAGSHPKPLHPNAVRVMRDEHGLDLAGHASKHLDVFADQRFDWVISLCDRVREVCPEFPGHPETIHWSIPNPAAGAADDEASYPLFQQTAAELATRIGFLLAVLADRHPRPRAEGEAMTEPQ